MKLLLFCFSLIIPASLSAQESMNMEMLYHWQGGGNIASSAYGNTYNEVWGYAQNNREYAIIGTTEGTHFIDITELNEALEVDFIAGKQQGVGVVHRDYHTYNNYLYMVCQEGQSSLQIADLSYLPDSVHLIYDSDELLKGAHNIFIDTTQAVLYTVFTYRDDFNGVIRLQRIDISNPTSPELIEEFNTGPYIHDLYVDNGLALLNRGNTDMSIFDYNTTPASYIGSIDNYIGQGYNHSGYPTPEGDIYVMADETHGSPIKILDISDPTDIEVLATVSSGVNPNSIAHNQIVHQNKLYSAYYYDGIYVWSIENPQNPTLLGFYDTCTLWHQESFEGAWGVYPFLPSGNILVSDMQTGLWVFTLDQSVSVSETKSKNRLDIWPNPAKSVIHADISELGLCKYSVFSSTGREVLKGEKNLFKTLEINTESLSAGLYYLHLKTRKMDYFGRFIQTE